ncbi:hypothetical protein H0A66_08500 [Alcaligenaceae bacterium]|nr:hypothetical protein [Alcaligenaceae bacterium]
MMNIENGELAVAIGGQIKRVPLPEIAVDAVVRAWSVPEDYRANGLFVSVTQANDAQEVPACAPAAALYLGEVKMEAGYAAHLTGAKAAKLAEINADCDAAVATLAATYPDWEIQSWPQQVKEAEALVVDLGTAAPLLTAIAATRSLPLTELASRVLDKMNAYAVASGTMIGIRQAAEDQLDLATTIEAVAAIRFEMGAA